MQGQSSAVQAWIKPPPADEGYEHTIETLNVTPEAACALQPATPRHRRHDLIRRPSSDLCRARQDSAATASSSLSHSLAQGQASGQPDSPHSFLHLIAQHLSPPMDLAADRQHCTAYQATGLSSSLILEPATEAASMLHTPEPSWTGGKMDSGLPEVNGPAALETTSAGAYALPDTETHALPQSNWQQQQQQQQQQEWSEHLQHGEHGAGPARSCTELELQLSQLTLPTRPRVACYGDRFIPSRAATTVARQDGIRAVHAVAAKHPTSAYSAVLQRELLGLATNTVETHTSLGSSRGNMLCFQTPSSRPEACIMLQEHNSHASCPSRPPRTIASKPFKVLDAPTLSNDFYLNLLSWSSQNTLAVGLGRSVFLWTHHKTTKLDESHDKPCSLAWSLRGSYLAVGRKSGSVQVWDAATAAVLHKYDGHTARVPSLGWSAHMLASGSKDRSVFVRDVRTKAAAAQRLKAHRAEVCGIQWSPDGVLLASGGNDNKVMVWDARKSEQPLFQLQHRAAVKALAWSPHRHGLLASGAGTADRSIRFWTTGTGQCITTVDTGSQVCNLAWSRSVNELISTHGYSQHEINVWRYPGMTKLATLTGHASRVMYLALSPDGSTAVTGAGDETLRFWNIFPQDKSAGTATGLQHGNLARSQIR